MTEVGLKPSVLEESRSPQFCSRAEGLEGKVPITALGPQTVAPVLRLSQCQALECGRQAIHLETAVGLFWIEQNAF